MKPIYAILALFLILLAGCSTKPVKGGNTRQEVTPVGPVQTLSQPDNPEGRSTQTIIQTKRSIPEYKIIEEHTEIKTELDGSQDLAKILQMGSNLSRNKDVLFGLTMFIAAYLLYRNTWRITGALVAFGGLLSMLIGYWYGIGIGVAALFGVMSFKIAEAKTPS